MANIATAFANTLMGMGNRICNADLYLITDLTFWIYSKIRREDQKYRGKNQNL